MIEKIKAHWKEILIGILVLFSLNKCTTSCTRGQNLKKAEYVADSLTKVVESKNIQIDKLETDTANYINQIRMYTNFEMKRDAQDSINNANIAAQQAQTNRLIQENRRLRTTK